MRPAGRTSEESDDHPARPEANASARTRDDLRAGARLRPRISDRHGEADETTRSGGSLERSGIERSRHRRDAEQIQRDDAFVKKTHVHAESGAERIPRRR